MDVKSFMSEFFFFTKAELKEETVGVTGQLLELQQCGLRQRHIATFISGK